MGDPLYMDGREHLKLVGPWGCAAIDPSLSPVPKVNSTINSDPPVSNGMDVPLRQREWRLITPDAH